MIGQKNSRGDSDFSFIASYSRAISTKRCGSTSNCGRSIGTRELMHLPLYWDNSRALAGVTTIYKGLRS